ncbi:MULTISPECIES: TatD family hydrolase [unclassified Polaromonas]|uniref:TatD family hydrolase n=1 Tax=unclassified Polaromonas TaxID=2638319 RepID=UPI0018CA7ED3|nr:MULTISPECIES: TatD family hydrolase [unclassified Polaromonas]MBG6073198.1 TatD DNase family protein [Polaromonas sp. CG_9.7]MBG6115202.1 TatD DNase family protein [Polaromonas sp. CG_9.2]MDH6185031.1 TatD DNase family protein [Polaromonas sp. CG_23.6]
MFTDSHCHLSYPSLKENISEIRKAMKDAKVERALCICTTLEEFQDVHQLALTYDNFWCTVGVHPDNEKVQEPDIDDLVRRAKLERVVGIGETGLDYYRLGERTLKEMEWQRERFRVHIRAAGLTGKPLVIHTRNASNDTISILKEEIAVAATKGKNVRGVFHCFTETQEVARAALDLGFYISFSGVITFKNAADIREVARFIPLDRLLIETDSPYLSPMPYRGKTNNPSYVPFVAKQLAEIRLESLDTIALATSRNFEQLFTEVST